MQPRTEGAIALLPSGNLQGSVKFYCLATGGIITRDQWTELPIPAAICKALSDMTVASGEKIGSADPVFARGATTIPLLETQVPKMVAFEDPPRILPGGDTTAVGNSDGDMMAEEQFPSEPLDESPYDEPLPPETTDFSPEPMEEIGEVDHGDQQSPGKEADSVPMAGVRPSPVKLPSPVKQRKQQQPVARAFRRSELSLSSAGEPNFVEGSLCSDHG
jgi:hypothetical protein